MKKPKIKMTVTKEDVGYSACASVGKGFIATEGETMMNLKLMCWRR